MISIENEQSNQIKSFNSLDIVQIVKHEFRERFKKNPRYSLRAFSKSLGLSHTILSLVFSGKRNLSKKSIQKIAEALNLRPDSLASLSTVGDFKNESSIEENFSLITLEDFKHISDWKHYAILSLLELQTNNPKTVANPVWIADKLGISLDEATDTFNRLINIKLIEKTTDGFWKQTGKSIKVENAITTSYTTMFHKGLLNKAIHSLENDPIKVRNFSSITLATDPENIDYAKRRIRQFRRELTAELEARGEAKAVYNITVQIYPVSKID